MLCRLDNTCTLTNEFIFFRFFARCNTLHLLWYSRQRTCYRLAAHLAKLEHVIVMASFTVASSSALFARRGSSVPSFAPSRSVAPSQRRTRSGQIKASFHDTGYLIADAVSKVADKADKAVGSVNAPGWVLPVSYVPCPAGS